MANPVHRVMLFVYQREAPERLRYLIVRPAPRQENFWQPVHVPIEPGETVAAAALRRLGSGLHLPDPDEVVDIHHFERFHLGDFDCVDWTFACGFRKCVERLDLPADLQDYQWVPIDWAFQLIDEDASRRAVMKLHLALAG
ncbi:MAG: NUDIX domain-containing protein [Planctomycetota bacterium]